MLNHRNKRADWGAFFDRLTAGRASESGQATACHRVYRSDGDGTRTDDANDRAWLPFVGVGWKPKQETITVALGGLDHRIEALLVVWADDTALASSAAFSVGAARVTFWGALAMAITAGVGALFGVVS